MELALLWTLQVDPLTAALGIAHVQLERVLADNVSVYVGPSLRLYDAPWADPEPFRAHGAEVGVRFYPRANAPQGPWFMARGVAARMSTTDGSHDPEPGGYGSVLGGGTLILGGRFVLSGGLGVSYFAWDIGDYGVTGFNPAAHTALGIAF